jgi:hypothetical protein
LSLFLTEGSSGFQISRFMLLFCLTSLLKRLSIQCLERVLIAFVEYSLFMFSRAGCKVINSFNFWKFFRK